MTRTRWILFVAAALLAFAIGVARGVLEEPTTPEPAPAATTEPSAPPAEAPPGAAPSAVPAAAPFEPHREAIRAKLAGDLAAHFPELKLSSDEIDAAADALLRLRAARGELNRLPRKPENAARIEALTREIGEAYEDFEYVVELDPAEFTERVEPGLDADDEDAEE